jgi:Zn-dependent M28 family amino/carboxypeptidase
VLWSPHHDRSPRQEQPSRLRQHVNRLAIEIGPRNIFHYDALGEAAAYIRNGLEACGYVPDLQEYTARRKTFVNIAAARPGRSRGDEILIVGAHYDTHKNSPGANDNASAIAALLELARHFAPEEPPRTIRFVAFTNEEKPFTHTKAMGSRVYARACRERHEKIVGMLCLETIGFCSHDPGSQSLSLGGLLLPTTGDFLALVGNRPSRPLLHRAAACLTREADFPIRPVTLPTHFPGAWSSDHWSFWKEGFPAIMATDTAPLRYRHYHAPADTPDKLTFDWLSSVTEALKALVTDLASGFDVPKSLRESRAPGRHHR